MSYIVKTSLASGGVAAQERGVGLFRLGTRLGKKPCERRDGKGSAYLLTRNLVDEPRRDKGWFRLQIV